VDIPLHTLVAAVGTGLVCPFIFHTSVRFNLGVQYCHMLGTCSVLTKGNNSPEGRQT
jgi:hypothetical protein